jgi:aspartate aminotransferase
MVRKLEQIPGVIFAQPEGAFYIMAALPVDDADKFQLWLLNDFNTDGETVMFACGEPFYATPGKGRNEVRMAYVLKEKDLERAMDILKIALEQYNSQNA